jgi:hypothetical protein
VGIRKFVGLVFGTAALLALLTFVAGSPLMVDAAPAPGPAATTRVANAPNGAFSPSPLDFGNVTVGTTVTLLLKFTNTGDAKLNFNRSTGPDPDHGDTSGFNATDTGQCRNTNFFPTEQCSMQITFTALAPGLMTRTLTLYDEFTTGMSFSVELRATGIADTASATLVVAGATGPYRGTTDLSATLSGCTGGLGGHTITFTLATPAGNRNVAATTNAGGMATVSAASLTVDSSGGPASIPAGTYGPDGDQGILVAFAGDATCAAASGAATLVVTKLAPAITFADPGTKTYGDAHFALDVSSGTSSDPSAPPIVLTYDTPAACNGPFALPATVTILSAGKRSATARR